MIVKVQIPLASNMENPPILVYNEDRSIQQTFEFEDTYRLKQLMNGKPKAYFNAHLEDDILCLDDVVPDQEW